MDAPADALGRAREIAAAGQRPATGGSTHMLARLLEEIARWLECAPADVPLDIAGYWLSPDQQHRTRVLLSRPPDSFPAWREDDRDGAWRAVEHAWTTAAGCLRAGVIAAHSVGTDLVLASVLLRERGPHWTRDYLRWRAGLYPAGTAEIFAALAEAEPDADEVALARLRLPL